MTNDPTNLGSCCICETRGNSVRNLMTLHLKTLSDETVRRLEAG